MSNHQYGDPVHQAFWEGASRQMLMVQKCRHCERHQFYGRPHCRYCLSAEVRWVEVSGRGTVYSRTEVVRFKLGGKSAPYTVALVELEEGPRLMTNLVHGECEIGDPVRVCWLQREDAPPLPQFEPV